jgi:hypothetical protein
MKFSDALGNLWIVGNAAFEQVFRLIPEMIEARIRWEVFYRHDELPFVCPGPHLRAESKFVETNCNHQVDFCPFRGPDAPFALRRYYHDGKQSYALVVKASASRVFCSTS